MAALDFPNGPSIGDRYPTPAVAGLPQYKWDGEKWTTAAIDTTVAPPASATPLEDNATPQVGVTTKYAREDHVHPSTALKYSAQALTSAQQTQSRLNLAAAPIDALAYSGLQINGSMEVSQEKGTALSTATNQFVVDGLQLLLGGAGAVSVRQYTGMSGTFPGFSCAVILTVSTAQASIGAGDYYMLWQKIEGYRISRLGWGTPNAKPLTIGFWSAHNRPGTYSITVRNSVSNRGYAATYTQAVGDLAQYNVITIPGDTAGAWTSDNTAGLTLTFAVAMGSSNIASAANTWISTACGAAPGQINGIASTSDIFRITGVIVLPGIEAPSAERSPLIMRPYDQELLTCQRYWQSNLVALDAWYANAGTIIVQAINYAPRMRASPTVNAGTPLFTPVNHNGPAISSGTPSANSVSVQIFNNAAGRAYWYGPIISDARL